MASVLFVAAVLLSSLAVSARGLNITAILEPYPDFSLFNEWLSLTGVVNEVNNRTSITVLAPANPALQSYLSSVEGAFSQPDAIADTLRYQILLTYFAIPELEKISQANYTSVTTLLQTTGRANDSQGFVDLYHTGSRFLVGHFIPDSYGNETIITNVTQVLFDYSVLQVSSVVLPLPSVLALSPSPSPSPSPAPAPSSSPSPSPSPISSSPPKVGPPIVTKHGSHAKATTISKPLVLFGMLLAFGAALL